MAGHSEVYVHAAAGCLLALGFWIVVDGALQARIRSRLRAAPLCLPLLLAPAIYALFWFGFFTSPAAAVQLHAIRLTLQYFLDGIWPWLLGAWLVLAAGVLHPLLKKPF